MKIKNEDVTIRILEPVSSKKCKTCPEFLVKAEAVLSTKTIKKGSVVYYCYRCG